MSIAVVAILASIAIPGYARYLIRGNRSDAQQLMTTVANRETQYLLDARAYTNEIGAAGLNITSLDGWTCATACTNANYTISVTLEANGYRITATPSGKQAGDGTLLLTNSGERSRTVSGVDQGW